MSNAPSTVPDQEFQAAHNIGDLELICQVRKTPTVLYGIFQELVQQFYSTEENFPRVVIAKAWNRDIKKTGVWIGPEWRWNDDNPEFRPAIVVTLSTIRYTSTGGRSDGIIGGNLQDAETFHSRTGTGTVTFRHIGAADGEAVALADATQDYLDAYCGVIRSDFCFKTFNLVERVPTAPRERESKERWNSMVTMAFEFEDTWTIKLESQLLKKVTFNAGQGLIAGGIVQI